MSKELPDFLDPSKEAALKLQFEALDEGRSVTPTDIRARFPLIDVSPAETVEEVENGSEA